MNGDKVRECNNKIKISSAAASRAGFLNELRNVRATWKQIVVNCFSDKIKEAMCHIFVMPVY
jgi:hypothetical protein